MAVGHALASPPASGSFAASNATAVSAPVVGSGVDAAGLETSVAVTTMRCAALYLGLHAMRVRRLVPSCSRISMADGSTKWEAILARKLTENVDGMVIGKGAVTSKRREILDQGGDVICRMRPVRMARHLRLLPGIEADIEVGEQLRRLLFQPLHLVGDRHGLVAGGKRAEFRDLAFQFSERGFEIEIGGHWASKRGQVGAETGRVASGSQLFLASGWWVSTTSARRSAWTWV